MEPTKPPVFWGPSAWNFLHGASLDPLAGPTERLALVELAHTLTKVLPCPSCRKSYRKTFHRSFHDFSGDSHQVGDFFIHVHDCVNLKLDKPTSMLPPEFWKHYQLKRFMKRGFSSYLHDMFFFLFTVAAVYPDQYTAETKQMEWYRDFFHQVIQAVSHRAWGKRMGDYLKTFPVSTPLSTGRQALMRWVYEMYQATMRDTESLFGPVPSMARLCELMKLMRRSG